MGIRNKTLTPEQALQKLRHYCGYQERCHREVVEKLYELGIRKKEHDAMLAALIEGGYLNEERFAIAYAGGKFRIKQWGRIKIAFALRQKQVSEYSIKKALRQIDEEAYWKTLIALTEGRYSSLKAVHWMTRRKKTMDFLQQHGFEPDLVQKAIRQVTSGD